MTPPIRIEHVPGKGRGVVAIEDIARGTIISAGPIITVNDASGIYDLVWCEDKLTLGAQSLCNDSKDPNCVSVDYNQVDLLVSIKDIAKGEELTLCYGDFDD